MWQTAQGQRAPIGTLSWGVWVLIGLAVLWSNLGCSPQATELVYPNRSTASASSSTSPPLEASANHAPRAHDEVMAEALSDGDSGMEVAVATPVPPFQLVLPRDEAYLRQPLPPPNERRYEHFREQARIVVGQSHLRRLDLLPDEQTIVSMSDAEATLRVYDLQSRRLLANHTVESLGRFDTGGIAAWPNAGPPPRILVGTPTGLQLLSVNGGERIAMIDPTPADDVRWSPDRRILVARTTGSSRQTSTLRFYSRQEQELTLVGMLEFAERVDGWDLSHDNRLLAVSHYPSDRLRVIDLWTGQDVLRIPGPKYAGAVAFRPDGRYVAVGGEGLLVVDIINPARRVFFSHVYNNIAHVRFSPSGDAIGVSAYDGRIRLLGLIDESRRLELQELATLRHAGSANVYEFVFEADGNALISVSGDQTIRRFANSRPSAVPPTNHGNGAGSFRTLEEWRQASPQAAQAWPPPPPPSMKDGHYHPPVLSGRPLACRLQPGLYACRITTAYRLRDCSVQRTAQGHTLLEIHSGNLLSLRGVVYDDGPVVRFEGWLAEASNLLACPGCERQPIHGVLRGGSKHLQGVLTFRNYYDPYSPPEVPPPDVAVEEANDRYPLMLRFVKALPAPEPTKRYPHDDLIIIP